MTDTGDITLFISHHSSTFETAEQVEAALAKRGVKCWIAPRDVEPGEPFDRSVQKAIESSAAILLLFCEESDKSRHVKRELILGDTAGRPIIPLRLEALDPGELAYHLADTQWIDWIDRREAVMDRVAAQAHQFAGLPVTGGGRPARPIDNSGDDDAAAPVPAQDAKPPKRGGTAITIVAIVAAAIIAIVWIDGQSKRFDPHEDAANRAADEAGAMNAEDQTSEAGDASPEPATPLPTPELPTSDPTSPIPAPAPAAPTPAPASAGPQTSYNCDASSRTSEFLICGSPTLAAQDQEINVLYRQALQMARRLGGNGRNLRRNQRQWLAERDACNTEACISGLQQLRIAYLRNGMEQRQ